MKHKHLILSAIIVAVAFLAPASFAETIERVSVDSSGNQAARGSRFPSISADGRYVAFLSWDSTLVPGDTNNAIDIFVHDRVTGATERVNVDSDGNQANGGSEYPAISANGRFVIFRSAASNLVPGDTNNTIDTFVHDRVTGVTERVSVDSQGNEANRWTEHYSISADGRYVAFQSWASNLVPGDTNNTADVFYHDRVTGETVLISVDGNGNQTGGGCANLDPVMSADGRYVAFSCGGRLAPGDKTWWTDVYVRDMVTGTIELASVDSSGNQANYVSYVKDISSDGRYVSFVSFAYNLVPNDTNWSWDAFVHDRVTGATKRVSVDSDGNQANGYTYDAYFSGDSRYVVFTSSASNLVPGDTNGMYEVFIHDMETGSTERLAKGLGGAQVNGITGNPSISADGRYVAFESYASNLVSGDTNGASDIFVRDSGPDLPETSEEFIALIEEMLASGEITNHGIANSLTSTLKNIQQAEDKGNSKAAANMLAAFINKVEAQAGKAISAESAALLMEAAMNLMGNN